MSIDQLDKIDIISTTPAGEVVLHIADHLEWDSEKEHILLLQDKINAYLQFIESDQLLSEYPSAIDKRVSIEIIFKFEPPISTLEYLNKFKEVVNGLDIPFSWRIHSSDKQT